MFAVVMIKEKCMFVICNRLLIFENDSVQMIENCRVIQRNKSTTQNSDVVVVLT